jgi:Ca2+-binding EF-hand superfamily protein
MRAVFDTIDRNHDGSIDVRELLLCLRKHPDVAEFMHLPMHVHQEGGTRETFEEMFQAIDKDGSRDVTWPEFESYFAKYEYAEMHENVERRTKTATSTMNTFEQMLVSPAVNARGGEWGGRAEGREGDEGEERGGVSSAPMMVAASLGESALESALMDRTDQLSDLPDQSMLVQYNDLSLQRPGVDNSYLSASDYAGVRLNQVGGTLDGSIAQAAATIRTAAGASNAAAPYTPHTPVGLQEMVANPFFDASGAVAVISDGRSVSVGGAGGAGGARGGSVAPRTTSGLVSPTDEHNDRVGQMRAVFDTIDRNHDGSIDVRELLLCLRKHPDVAEFMHLPMHVHQEGGTRETFEEMFQAIDKDGSRDVTWPEFRSYFSKYAQGDGRGSGTSTASSEAETRTEPAFALTQSHPYSHPELVTTLEDLFEAADKNGVGLLHRDELLSFVTRHQESSSSLNAVSPLSVPQREGALATQLCGLLTVNGDLSDAVNRMDVNLDGRISRGEFVAAAESALRYRQGGERGGQTLSAVDRAEAPAQTGTPRVEKMAKLRAVFDTIDRNHDGSIDVRELLLCLRKHPDVAEFMHLPVHVRQEGGTRETFEEMFQAIDKDGSRDVTWPEFESYFSSQWDKCEAKTGQQQQQQQHEQEQEKDQQVSSQSGSMSAIAGRDKRSLADSGHVEQIIVHGKSSASESSRPPMHPPSRQAATPLSLRADEAQQCQRHVEQQQTEQYLALPDPIDHRTAMAVAAAKTVVATEAVVGGERQLERIIDVATPPNNRAHRLSAANRESPMSNNSSASGRKAMRRAAFEELLVAPLVTDGNDHRDGRDGRDGDRGDDRGAVALLPVPSSSEITASDDVDERHDAVWGKVRRGGTAGSPRATSGLVSPTDEHNDRVGQMRAVFDTIDRNHDGSIDVRELLLCLRKHPDVAEFMHLPMHVHQEGGTRETFEEMFQAIDKDGSRDVTWPEFRSYFSKYAQGDGRGSGTSTASSEAETRTEPAFALTRSHVGHVKAVFDHLDADHSGLVDLSELLEALMEVLGESHDAQFDRVMDTQLQVIHSRFLGEEARRRGGEGGRAMSWVEFRGLLLEGGFSSSSGIDQGKRIGNGDRGSKSLGDGDGTGVDDAIKEPGSATSNHSVLSAFSSNSETTVDVHEALRGAEKEDIHAAILARTGGSRRVQRPYKPPQQQPVVSSTASRRVAESSRQVQMDSCPLPEETPSRPRRRPPPTPESSARGASSRVSLRTPERVTAICTETREGLVFGPGRMNELRAVFNTIDRNHDGSIQVRLFLKK